jgi:GPH family glycoside/pentoside/hexuronide:cation symporter
MHLLLLKENLLEPAKKIKDKLSTRIKWLYSIGSLSTSMPQAIIAFFQLYFLTDIAGLRPDYAAWAIAAGRLWDAINDPLFGVLADHIKSKHGRRRVLLLYSAIPLGISYAVMWLIPNYGDVGLAVYYALTFIVFDTCYTAMYVGYNALTPEMTSDYDERSSLNGYRMAISIASTLAVIILTTVLGWYIKDQKQLFAYLGIGLGIASALPLFIVFRVTKVYRTTTDADPLPAWQSIKTTIQNKPFIQVMGLYLMSWTAVSILAAVLVYYANYYLRTPEIGSYLVLAAQGSAIAFVPVVVWLSKKFDKRTAFILGSLSATISLLGIYTLSPSHIVPTFILAGLCGLGIATAYIVPWAMLPDIIEHDELETGRRREGSFYALAAFFQKLGTGAALWAMGQVFSITGYITPSANTILPVQSADTITAIRWFASIIPAVLFLAGILFSWKYSISREEHKKMLERLNTGMGLS